jgi:hypothetical protein
MNPTLESVVISSITTQELIYDEKMRAHYIKFWQQKGWPVKMFNSDPLSARILQENAVFSAIAFHGLKWEWENDELYVPVKCKSQGTEESEYITEMRKWDDLKKVLRVVDSAGWLLLDGAFFGEYGLNGIDTDDHRWEWKELKPAFVYKDEKKPDYCYLDVISSCFEHEGMMVSNI